MGSGRGHSTNARNVSGSSSTKKRNETEHSYSKEPTGPTWTSTRISNNQLPRTGRIQTNTHLSMNTTQSSQRESQRILQREHTLQKSTDNDADTTSKYAKFEEAKEKSSIFKDLAVCLHLNNDFFFL